MSELRHQLVMTKEHSWVFAYPKSEADKVIAEITEGAISMFRCSETCRGLDLKSPLGKIANIAFKHWNYVELIQNELTQLQEDKDCLRKNNRHLLDEIEHLKEKMERRERHHKYKQCLAMANACDEAYGRECLLNPEQMTDKEFWKQQTEFWPRWSNIWRKLAEHFKEGK